MNNNVISITQFNNYIHNIFEAEELLHNIKLYGEVSGFSISGGHAYFTIKDEEATLSCVSFGFQSDYIPQNGDLVLITGSPNFYIKGGRFSFNIRKIERYGQGFLYKQFLELKEKLQNLGLFAESRKKPLPRVIKKVGVVTSETGAVLQDIIDITKRRNPMLDILLFPAKVQGIGAEETIIKGIVELEKTDVDLIIIARGGGSAEDLSIFNTEKLALVVSNCSKMTISAVGHETDFTIVDFVADLRAPTPSAAAELVAVDMSKKTDLLNSYCGRLCNTVFNYINNNSEKLELLIPRFNYALKTLIEKHNTQINNQYLQLCKIMDNVPTLLLQKVELLNTKLESLNPINIIARGYAQIFNKQGGVTSINQIQAGEELELIVADGKIISKVISKGERNGF